MNTPKVSYVMPCFNRAGLLGYNLKSLIKQTIKDFEIIITDNSPDIFQHLGKMVDYLKDKNGKINKNIKLLKFTNLNADLLNFLSDVNVSSSDLEKIKPFMKDEINISKKFFKEDIDISKLNLNDFYIEDLLFYLSIDNIILEKYN